MGAVTAATGNQNRSVFSFFREDFFASIVVFLVALPLCMGIAIASEAPIAAGVITGILGGIVVGVIGGAPLQVSGPAAGLTVLIFEIVRKHGWESVGPIVLAAGLLQIAAGLFRLGQWFRAVSPAVIQGMLAGIGVLILASQFHVMFDEPARAGWRAIWAMPATLYLLFDFGHIQNQRAFMVGALTIAVIVLWKWAPKALKFISPPLAGVVAGSGLGYFFNRRADDGKINLVELPGNFADAVRLPVMGDFKLLFSETGVLEAISLAFIASAETLLCAAAVDRIQTRSRTKYDRELWAQGVGNTLCGLLGGLPMTGVIVRSSANVNAGAQTRVSAILHGFWLLLFVAVLPTIWGGKTLLHYVPVAALAGVLVYTGFKLINFNTIRELYRFGKGEVLIYCATVVIIVATDLLTGVLLGMAFSVAKLVWRFSYLRVRVEDHAESGRTDLRLNGSATFIRLPQLAAALEAVQPDRELHIHLDKLTYIDHACLDLMMNWEKQHKSSGGTLRIDWDQLTARFRSPPAGTEEAPTAAALRVEQRELVGGPTR